MKLLAVAQRLLQATDVKAALNPEGRGSSAIFGTGTAATTGPFSSRAAKRHLTAFAGDQAIDLVFGCAKVIAETTSAAEVELERADGRDLPTERSDAAPNQRLAPPDLVELLKQPNPWQTWDTFIEELVIDVLLTGDFFVYEFKQRVDGTRPLALYRLPPDRVTVKTGEESQRPNDLIGAYEYDVPGHESEPALYRPEEVIHLRFANPHSPFRGAGIIAGGVTMFDLELALQQSKAAYFENGARLSGVLETDRSVPDSLGQKLKREFDSLFAGPKASGLTALLQAGVKYRAVQSNASEAELVPLTDQTQKRILALFKVPRSKLGLEGSGEAAEERREFANGMMKPLLKKISTIFTERLTLPGWECKLCIEYEYQMPIEEQIKLAGTYATLPGITIKEIRDKAGLDPLAEVLSDSTEAKRIEETVLNLPGDNTNQSQVKDRNLPGEQGRPPAPENTAAIPAGADLPADAAAQQRREAQPA